MNPNRTETTAATETRQNATPRTCGGNCQAGAPAALMTDKETAALLGISTRHLHRLRDRQKIVPPLRLGGSVRWRRQQVLDWLEDGAPPVGREGAS